MRPWNVGAARATLTRKDSDWSGSLKSLGNQGRGIGEGWAVFSPRPCQRACQVPSTRQDGDALSRENISRPGFKLSVAPLGLGISSLSFGSSGSS